MGLVPPTTNRCRFDTYTTFARARESTVPTRTQRRSRTYPATRAAPTSAASVPPTTRDRARRETERGPGPRCGRWPLPEMDGEDIAGSVLQRWVARLTGGADSAGRAGSKLSG